MITCLDWKDSSNTLNMTVFASEYLATVQDIVYEGSLPYFGLPGDWADDRPQAQHHGIDLPDRVGFLRHSDHRHRAGVPRAIGGDPLPHDRDVLEPAGPLFRGGAAAAGRAGAAVRDRAHGTSAVRSRRCRPPRAKGARRPRHRTSRKRPDSNSGDSPAPVAALGDDPAPGDALAGSLPGGSQASPTDSLLGQTDSAPAPLSGGATPSPQTGLADEPADDQGRQGRRVRFAAARTSQFVRKPPSFRPRVADTFVRSHSRPEVYSVRASGDDAEPGMFTDQDDETQTIQANPSTSSSEGTANDQRADTVAGTLDVGMRGSAGAGRAAQRPKGPDTLSGRLRKVPDTRSGPGTRSGPEGQDQRPPGSNDGPDGMQKVPPPGLGTAGDWLDRDFGGGAYGPPGTSGKIVGGASAIAGVAPVAGDIQDVGQVVTGRDANGNQLSTGDRVLTGVAAAVPIVSGPMLRWAAKKVIKGLAKVGPAITAGTAKAGRAMTAGAAKAGRAMTAGTPKLVGR